MLPLPAQSIAPRFFRNPISDHIQWAGNAKQSMLKQENKIMALKLALSCIAPDDIDVAKEHNPI